MIIVLSVVLLISILSFIYVYFYRKKFHLINQIPGPPVHPIYGNLKYPISISNHSNWSYKFLKWFNENAKQYSKHGVMRVWLGPLNPVVILTKPETAQIILSNPTMIEKATIYKMFRNFLGSGLGTSSIKRWKYNRKLLNPAFNYNILKNFLPIINSQLNVFTKVIGKQLAHSENGIIADIRPLVSHYVLDTLCETSMGYRSNSQVTEKCDYLHNLQKLIETAFKVIHRPWLWFSLTIFRMTKTGKLCEQYIHELRYFSDRIIEQRKRQENQEQLVFIDILLEHHHQYPEKLSLYNVRSEVNTFMFAGHHTNSSSIVWTLQLIGNHPKVQQKIHEELDSVMNDSEEDIDMNKLRDMKYLEASIRESLRLYPVAPVIGRQTTHEVQCGQYVIPSNTTVMIFISFIQRLEEYWPNADKFIPERFMDNTQLKHSYAFIPFSAGPRTCIGQKFGLMQQKAVLAKILRKYTIKSMLDMNSIEIGFDFVLFPKSEIPLQFVFRS